jgi:hypothetical protein
VDFYHRLPTASLAITTTASTLTQQNPQHPQFAPTDEGNDPDTNYFVIFKTISVVFLMSFFFYSQWWRWWVFYN